MVNEFQCFWLKFYKAFFSNYNGIGCKDCLMLQYWNWFHQWEKMKGRKIDFQFKIDFFFFVSGSFLNIIIIIIIIQQKKSIYLSIFWREKKWNKKTYLTLLNWWKKKKKKYSIQVINQTAVFPEKNFPENLNFFFSPHSNQFRFHFEGEKRNLIENEKSKISFFFCFASFSFPFFFCLIFLELSS